MRTRLVVTTLLCVLVANAYAVDAEKSSIGDRVKSLQGATAAQAAPVDKSKASYAVGYTLGENISKQFSGIKQSEFEKGLNDAFAGKDSQFGKEETTKLVISFQREAMSEHLAERKAQAEKNKVDGEAFLNAKKSESGVKSTESGLLYKVIKEGSGDSPTLTDRVKVTYQGTLIDGTEFDARTDANNPMTFNLTSVIPGWREALQLMKPGATYEIYVPSKLGYGARGTPGLIGPNAALVFKVTLISVEKGTTSQNKTASS